MKKYLTITILVIYLMLPNVAEAKASLKEQNAFTKEYQEKQVVGGKEFYDWKQKIQDGSDEEKLDMLNNLKNDKTAGGKKKTKKQLVQEKEKLKKAREENAPPPPWGKDDPGPQDWSDHNIKTDGKGNVIGFEEKDFKEKDTDGDGEISDEEREEWNKKKAKENKEAGGAPGAVPPVADWDDNGDGIPNKDFERMCWECKQPDEKLHECTSGWIGSCTPNPCKELEDCFEHEETKSDGTKLNCYECSPGESIVQWCEERGYSSDPTCGGCPSGPCVPIDVDIRSGDIVPTNKTRERGSTQQCYACMRVTSIEITYHIYIIETPFGIVVLDKDAKSKLNALADFDVSSVMGLARSDSSAMDKVKGMMGSMGLDPMALLGGSLNIQSLSSLLQQGMNDKKNKYGDNCFDDFEKPNFAKQDPPSSSERDKKAAAKNKKKGIEGGPRVVEGEQEFGVDPEQAMAVDGPIIACGKSGKEKALMVLDSSGNPIQKILQSTLQENPNAIMEALQKAQSLNQKIQSLRQGGVSGLVNNIRQKAIGMVTKKIQDVVFGKKGDPATKFNPNDQFFQYTKKKKKKLLGILGSSTGIAKAVIGQATGPKKRTKGKTDYKEQWGIQRIGYLPMDDADSAWNIADGNEKNVIVAVVDSGMDFEHPDLPQYIWTNPHEVADNGIDDDGNGFIDDVHGWNFIENNNDLTDERGHGTHVAGIIAAKRNNSIGIAGINPGAIIMPVKVADKEGKADSVKIYQGINYAVNHGAQVINVSLGGRGTSKMIQSALNHAREMGVFVTVASGNTGEYLGNVSPASANNAFTVSAIDYDGNWSTISSVGPNNGLLAPGEEILSLRSKDSFHKRAVKDPIAKLYFRQSGTSFSTPMVAATASLLLTKNPNLSPEQIEDILLNTAIDMGDEGWDGQHGAGLLNATEALRAADRTDFLTVKLDRFKINKDDSKRLESVDVYATVRGEFKDFTVGVGKGKRASKFKQMAGPFTKAANHAWVARIGKDNLRGSTDWVVNIEVKDKNGNVKTAQAVLLLD